MSDKWNQGRDDGWRSGRERDDDRRSEADPGVGGQDRSWAPEPRGGYGARDDAGPAGGYAGRPLHRQTRFGAQDYTGDHRMERYGPTRAGYHRSGFGDPGFDAAHLRAGGGHDGLYADRPGENWEAVGRDAGQFLHRAGERVAAWFGGDHRASAANDPGHRGRGPQGYRRTDERINDDVHDRLTDDRWLDASGITVRVADGEVTLDGTVENRGAKHRAEHIVEDVPGVTHVQNNLRARQPNMVGDMSESVLGAQIRAQGLSDPDDTPIKS